MIAEFHLADAIFQPDIAEKTAWARGHAAKAVVNEQLMNVAIAYNELLDAHQDARILEESRNRMAELFKITNDFAEASEGLRADADRVETELILMDSRIVEVNEQTAMASARLAEALSIDAWMSLEIRNLGFGEKAARRSTSARVEQAKFEKLRVMDEVARQVSESYSQIQFRRQQFSLTQRAIATAQQSYDRNVSRIRDGQGLPIEVLQSVQALEAARRVYLASVVGYNEAQFRLQWALGWPVNQG